MVNNEVSSRLSNVNMKFLSLLVIIGIFVAVVSEDTLVSSCSDLANDSEACLNSRIGETWPDDYCSFCVTGEEYTPSCMTWPQAEKVDQSVTACWDQPYPAIANAKNTTLPSLE